MAVTMRDVAQHAGVSQRTVSNVVTGSVPVRPETRAKVEASIKALGYRTFAPARQLRQGRTSTVALALPSLTERYFADFAQTIIDQAREHGLQVVVTITDAKRENELAMVRGEQLVADGVILASVALTEADDGLPHPGFPLVLVGDREVSAEIAHVGLDNRRAVQHATQHLLDLGRRRIALLGVGTGPIRTREQRTEGYLAALAGAGISVDESLLVPTPHWDHDSGASATAGLVAAVPGVDGIVAMNDSTALGAMGALVRAGRRVPDDVAVVGFDNIREGRQSVPGLTSVGPQPEQVAAAALAELNAQLEGGSEPRHYQVPHQLLVRGSTAAGRD